jgi:hypothetical protein
MADGGRRPKRGYFARSVSGLACRTCSSGRMADAFGIELKAGRGALSPAQTVWHATVTALGHRVYVVRSLDELEAVLREESVPAVGTLDQAMLN